jgi:hypothetical protein
MRSSKPRRRKGFMDSLARTSGWLGVSTVGAPPLAQIAQCLSSKRIKAARCDIFLDLPIPGGSVQLGEPGPEHGEVLRRKSPDCVLDFFDGAHDDKLTPPEKSAQPRQACGLRYRSRPRSRRTASGMVSTRIAAAPGSASAPACLTLSPSPGARKRFAATPCCFVYNS